MYLIFAKTWHCLSEKTMEPGRWLPFYHYKIHVSVSKDRLILTVKVVEGGLRSARKQVTPTYIMIHPAGCGRWE